MANKEAMIQWMEARKGKIIYSMDWRLRQGPTHYDCSSAVISALIAGGFLPKNTGLGNTDTLYKLEGSLLIPITRAEVRRGDIFVAGHKNGSGGSAGHTGIFLDNQTIIHCTYGYGSKNMAVTPAKNWMGDYSGLPVHFYRLKDGNNNITVNDRPQMGKLAVDGQFGNSTAKRLQEYFGCAIRDGIISGQIKSEHNQYIYACEWGSGGSNLVRAMQKWLGVEQDGYFGTATIRALQSRMGTSEDGYISPVSDCIKIMQNRLNDNRL